MALAEDFKNALSCWASGVSVVATRADGLSYGITVSSLTSVSLDPPLVLVCLHKNNRIGSLIDGSRAFGVSILAAEQVGVSSYFASPGRAPSSATSEAAHYVDSPHGQPVLDGCHAWLDCALHGVVDGGDHTIVIGRVRACGSHPDRAPLLYHNRAYRRLGG